MLAYRAVPVRFLSSLYGMCCFERVSLYFLAKPKSMMNNYNREGEKEREREREREREWRGGKRGLKSDQ